jgi:hypothetical protein
LSRADETGKGSSILIRLAQSNCYRRMVPHLDARRSCRRVRGQGTAAAIWYFSVLGMCSLGPIHKALPIDHRSLPLLQPFRSWKVLPFDLLPFMHADILILQPDGCTYLLQKQCSHCPESWDLGFTLYSGSGRVPLWHASWCHFALDGKRTWAVQIEEVLISRLTNPFLTNHQILG